MPWKKPVGQWENLDDTSRSGSISEESGRTEEHPDGRSVCRRLPRWACYTLIILAAVVVVGSAAALYVSTHYGDDGFNLTKGSSARFSMILGPIIGVIVVVGIVTVCVVYEVKRRRRQARGDDGTKRRIHMDSHGVHNAGGDAVQDPNKHIAYQDSRTGVHM